MNKEDEERIAAKNAPNDWRPLPTGPGWLERVFGVKTFVGRLGCLGSGAIIAALPILGVSYCSHQVSENARLAAVQKAKDDAVANAEYQAKYNATVTDGTVCADGSSGSNIALVDAVKSSLRDPDSFKHVRTVIGRRNGEGQYPTLMHYQARNGFGGYNVGLVHARLHLVEKGVCGVATLAPLVDG